MTVVAAYLPHDADRGEREHGYWYPPIVHAFMWTRNGTYCHRVRYACDYGNGLHGHTWCGSSGVHSRMSPTPDPDRKFCGTCHGRAIGAGQIDHEGTPLIFTPNVSVGLGTCVYQRGSGGPYNFGYSQCHRAATVPIDEVPGVGVCHEHAQRWPPAHRWRRHDNIEFAREVAQARRPVAFRNAFSPLGYADTLTDDGLDYDAFWG